jgi:hypothetical protein
MTAANGFILPLMPRGWGSAGTGTFTAFSTVLDATTDKNAFIFQAEDAITITRLGVRLNAKTGTSPTYSINIQGVNTSGMPDGTIKGGGSPASATFTATSWTAGTFNWVTLTNSYTCARGELLAIVVEYSSGTINTSNFITLTATVLFGDANNSFPSGRNSTGSWTTQTAGGRLIFGYGSSSRAYGNPLQNATTQAYNSGSTSPTGDEYAARFIIPTWFCSTYKIRGLLMQTTFVAAQDMTWDLKEASSSSYGTALQSVTLDGDLAGPSPSNDSAIIIFDETTLSTLTAGTAYRLAQRPASTGSTNVYYIEVASSADFQAMAPFGDEQVYLEKTNDGGSWTAVTNQRPLMSLILDDVTPPSGGGGLLRHPGMVGGLVA